MIVELHLTEDDVARPRRRTSGIACTRSVPTSSLGAQGGVEHEQQHHHQRARPDRRQSDHDAAEHTDRDRAQRVEARRSPSAASRHRVGPENGALDGEADRREQQGDADGPLHDVVDLRRDRRTAASAQTDRNADGTEPITSHPTRRRLTVPFRRWTPPPIGFITIDATRSLDTAWMGGTLKSSTRIGVIRAPPPMPVRPTTNPTPRPASAMSQSMCISNPRMDASRVLPYLTSRKGTNSARRRVKGQLGRRGRVPSFSARGLCPGREHDEVGSRREDRGAVGCRQGRRRAHAAELRGDRAGSGVDRWRQGDDPRIRVVRAGPARRSARPQPAHGRAHRGAARPVGTGQRRRHAEAHRAGERHTARA